MTLYCIRSWFIINSSNELKAFSFQKFDTDRLLDSNRMATFVNPIF